MHYSSTEENNRKYTARIEAIPFASFVQGNALIPYGVYNVLSLKAIKACVNNYYSEPEICIILVCLLLRRIFKEAKLTQTKASRVGI